MFLVTLKLIGATICPCHESKSHLLLHKPLYQRSKGVATNRGSVLTLRQIFKVVLSKAFDLKCTIPEISAVGEPIFEYMNV